MVLKIISKKFEELAKTDKEVETVLKTYSQSTNIGKYYATCYFEAIRY
jgi:hypothetical protein